MTTIILVQYLFYCQIGYHATVTSEIAVKSFKYYRFNKKYRLWHHQIIITNIPSRNKKKDLIKECNRIMEKKLKKIVIIAHHYHFLGCVGLLQCELGIEPNKRTKRYRRHFCECKREFNRHAYYQYSRSHILSSSSSTGELEGGDTNNNKTKIMICHQPYSNLPFTVSQNTTITFAYILTSMVICIDASPTITSTFGTDFASHKKR